MVFRETADRLKGVRGLDEGGGRAWNTEQKSLRCTDTDFLFSWARVKKEPENQCGARFPPPPSRTNVAKAMLVERLRRTCRALKWPRDPPTPKASEDKSGSHTILSRAEGPE